MSTAELTGLKYLLFMECKFSEHFGQYAGAGYEPPNRERLSLIDGWLKYVNSTLRGGHGRLSLGDLEPEQAVVLMAQLETARTVSENLGLRRGVVVTKEQDEMILARSQDSYPPVPAVA